MKNIHILPTDKPSRLLMSKRNNLQFLKDNASLNPNNHFEGTNQNIYITSGEEIKIGDWMIRGNEQPIKVTKDFFWDFGVKYYKITLTTDKDLIGVQAIDDEFLEWFVKNPSCEEVEVEWLGTYTYGIVGYKIIIPKEEPKQHVELINDNIEEFDKAIKLPKQETLEEAKDLNYWKNNAEEDYLKVPISVLRYITELEKQQERSYSEEEVIEILNQFDYSFDSIRDTILQWFKQFKKK